MKGYLFWSMPGLRKGRTFDTTGFSAGETFISASTVPHDRVQPTAWTELDRGILLGPKCTVNITNSNYWGAVHSWAQLKGCWYPEKCLEHKPSLTSATMTSQSRPRFTFLGLPFTPTWWQAQESIMHMHVDMCACAHQYNNCNSQNLVNCLAFQTVM